jgi:hypothetical protein
VLLLVSAAQSVAQTPDQPPMGKADYTIRIGTGLVELSPEHIVPTALYNGQFPEPMVRGLQTGSVLSYPCKLAKNRGSGNE